MTEKQNGGPPAALAMTGRGFEPTTIDEAWRFASALARSTIVPRNTYFGQPDNCLISLDLASRLQVPWLTVMQHVYIVHGRPAMTSTLTTALVNRSGVFTDPLEYEVDGDDPYAEDYRVRAYAIRSSNNKKLFGPWITWKLVKAEGWDKPKGEKKLPSKWTTLPDQMFHYRAASWFQRRYCPEVTLGMLTTEEADEIPVEPKHVESVDVSAESGVDGLKSRLRHRQESNGTQQSEQPQTEKEPEKTPDEDAQTAGGEAPAPKGRLRKFACDQPTCTKTYKYGLEEGQGVQCECGNGTLILKTEKDRLAKEANENDWPWCEACQSYHHPENPTCKNKTEAAVDNTVKTEAEQEAEDTAKAKFGQKVGYICSVKNCSHAWELDEDDEQPGIDENNMYQCAKCLRFTANKI
jgi:hypothetical protein